MPSSDIDITATGAAASLAKYVPQGVISEKKVATVAATAASGTLIGMIRFQKGYNLIGFQIASEDLDTGTDVTLDVGFVYDDSTLTDNTDAFLDGVDIAQDAGSLVYPVADGLLTATGFVAEGDGWLVVLTGGGATTTEGDITVCAQGTYDN